MRIDRTLRPFFSSPMTMSSDVHFYESLNQCQGKISTKNYDLLIDDEGIDKAPDFIRLRCKLEPVFYEGNAIGTYIYGGKSSTSRYIYEKDAPPLCALNIIYEGVGVWIDPLGRESLFKGKQFLDFFLNFGKILFQKSFLVVFHSVELKAHLENKGTVFSYDSLDVYGHVLRGVDLSFYRPIWGYGGAFRPQMPLHQMVQYYCTLDNQRDITTCPLFSQVYLREQGMNLEFFSPYHTPKTGKVLVAPPPVSEGSEHKVLPKYCTHTLEEEIVQGHVEFSLHDKNDEPACVDDTSLMHARLYRSIRVQQLGLSPYIDITFQHQTRRDTI